MIDPARIERRPGVAQRLYLLAVLLAACLITVPAWAYTVILKIVAVSEASVFKSLKDSANSLVQIHERFPDDVTAFELLLLTDNQLRAGQFILTPELANLLVTEELDPPNFFLRYVEF